MVFTCQLTPAEMRQAIGMNQSAWFWVRMVLVNVRVVIILGGVVVYGVISLMGGGEPKWGELAGALGVAVLLVGFRIWRYSSVVNQTAAQVNLACTGMTVDSNGISATGLSGASTFIPWSDVKRWKEATLVYTIGEAKAYKVIPKRVLTPMQVGELQGYLQMYVRPAGS